MSCPLPNDVIAEIISYLPAKAFFKLLPVCKTFYQLSSDSHFLLSQSYYNKAISGFFINSCNIFRSFIPIDPYAGVPSSSIRFLGKRKTIILGSAGGLVFVLQRKYGWFDAIPVLWVYNLARGTRCQLPSPPGKCSEGGIAVRFINNGDGVTTDYKLVYLTRRWSALQHCRVYDSVARAWTMDKELDFGGRELDLEHPVVCDDTVFWASSELRSYMWIESCVVAFDIREERTQIITMPKDAVVDFFDTIGIAKWEGKSLCLIRHSTFSGMFVLWLLNKTGDGAPGWVKVQEISLAELGFREPCYVSFVVLSEMASTKLLVFTIDQVLYSLNINDGELKKLSSLTDYHTPTLFPYSNTLRPCGEQEELLEAI
ncbi:uncharacterized protein LOC135635985 [Musa acuminata AAA Group]|uniref:uncharacterized protein LOC103978043 n=1 Tax=Musa acuminata AAA Group TaxID=214697 RepID=UPI0031D343FB